MAPDMFSGWGIRTLSTAHPAYNPLSYHLGSVWAVENATICFGLRRLRLRRRGAAARARALRPRRALQRLPHPGDGRRLRAGRAPDARRLPALEHAADVERQRAAAPAAVAARAGCRSRRSTPLVVDPLLPEWLPAVELHGLRVGETRATLRCLARRRRPLARRGGREGRPAPPAPAAAARSARRRRRPPPARPHRPRRQRGVLTRRQPLAVASTA